jgi:hypothetical protein
MLASVVKEALTDFSPDCLCPVEPHGVGLLKIDNLLATSAGDAQHMALDLGQPPLTGLQPA